MGFKRFTAILTNMCPNENEFKELCNILNVQFNKFVIPGTHLAFDETVYAYCVSKIVKDRAAKLFDPIPVVFIPRKPHPNGLLSYKMSTILPGGKPFTLVLVPHYSIPQISPTEALNKAIDFFKSCHPNNVVHVVADSAFGSFSQMKIMEEKGVYGTFSMAVNDKGWLWNLLKRSTYFGKWNAAVSGNVIASVFNTKETDDGYHQLLSNAFVATTKTVEITVNGETQSSQNGSLNPVYTRNFLSGKTKQQLCAICDENHIKKGKLTKGQMVDKIMAICNPTADNERLVNETVKVVDNNNLSDDPIHHYHYKEIFSFVDRQNKAYYKAPFTYGVRNWRSKMTLCIMNDTFYNVYALMNALQRVKYASFRDSLSSILFGLGNDLKYACKNKN